MPERREQSNRTRRQGMRAHTLELSWLQKNGLPLGAILILTGVLAYGSFNCNQNISTLPSNPPTITEQLKPTAIATAIARFTPINADPKADPVDSYYPQARKYPLKNNGQFSGPFGTARWFNFTDEDFNPEAANKTYSYFDQLSKKDRRYKYSSGRYNFEMGFAPIPIENKNLFLVPAQLENPPWVFPPRDVMNLPASTYYDINQTASFIRVYKQKDGTVMSDQNYNPNSSFYVEVCQTTIYVGTVTSSPDFKPQELICNSFGRAYQMKQDDFDYAKYVSEMRQFLFFGNDLANHPLYTLTPQEYAEIPIVGKIVS